MKPKCFTDDNQHSRKYLTTIYSVYAGWNEDHQVNWCQECGAVVVESISDNRLIDHTKMKWPEITHRVMEEKNES